MVDVETISGCTGSLFLLLPGQKIALCKKAGIRRIDLQHSLSAHLTDIPIVAVCVVILK